MTVALAVVGGAVGAALLAAAARRRLPDAALPVCFVLFVLHAALAASCARTAPQALVWGIAAGAALPMAALAVAVLTAGSQLRPGWWRDFERDLAAYARAGEPGDGDAPALRLPPLD